MIDLAPSPLLVLAHPAYERARVNPTMVAAAERIPGMRIHDLYELYPDFTVDVRQEQALLAAHDPIILQFPLYWYSGPALLKEWLDLVWLHGFAYGDTATALAGKTLFCAVSTGGRKSAYDPNGNNRFTLSEFLRPFEQTAHLCRMRWAEPFAIHGASLITPGDLLRAGDDYYERLTQVVASAGRVLGGRA